MSIQTKEQATEMKLMVFDIGGTEIKYATMDDDFGFYGKGHVLTPKDSYEDLPVRDLKIVRCAYGNDANLIGAFMNYREING